MPTNAKPATSDAWRRIWATFHDALDRPIEERERFLAQSLPDHPGERDQVRRLLAAHDDTGSLLDRPALALLQSAPAPARIGEWTVRHSLGDGGMGRVYLAARSNGEYEQLAAIKLIEAQPGEQQVFIEERRALAKLRHPFIAQFYDSGVCADGRHYLVMEYVEGQRLDAWAAAGDTTLEHRLRLFSEVSSAVHFAHSNLIVHHDLKPSNILVTAEGVPKLIDFGVATSPGDTGDPHVRHLTPAYASPEQLRGQPATTASDVFSLGVILYELCRGLHPFDSSATSVEARIESIATGAPSLTSKPRTAGNGGGAAADEAEQVRLLQLRRLGTWRIGELDAIIRAALMSDASLRYASAQALAQDVHHWLRREPLSIRSSSLRYRLRAAVSRHPLASVLALILSLLLIGGVIALVLQGQRLERALADAESQAQRATAAAGFLRDLFVQLDPERRDQTPTSAADVLEQGASRLDRIDDPGLRAEMESTLGEAFLHLGEFDRAERLFGAVLQRDPGTPEPPALQGMAAVRKEQARYVEAAGLQQRALDLLAGRDDEVEWQARLRLAELLQAQDQLAPARSMLETIPAARASRDLAAAVQLRLGSIALAEGDAAGAETHFRDALALQVAAGGNKNHDVARTHYALGVALHRLGRHAQARQHYESSLQLRRSIYGDPHYLTAQVLQALAALSFDSGDAREAVTRGRETLVMMTALHGVDSPRLANIHNNLGVALHDLGEFDQASIEFEAALKLHRSGYGGSHSRVASSLTNLALVLLDRGDNDGAMQMLEAAHEMASEVLPPNHPTEATILHLLGRAQFERDEFEAARATLERALRIREGIDDGRHPLVEDSLYWLAWLELADNHLDVALALSARALALREERLDENDWRRSQARAQYGALLALTGEEAAGRKIVDAALDDMSRQRGAGDWRLLRLRESISRARVP